MHGPGRMLLGDIEGLEIVEFILDLGPGVDVEAGGTEDRLDTAHGPGDRVHAGRRLAASRQRDIHRLIRDPRLQRGVLQRAASRLDRRLERGLGLVDRLARRRALIRRSACPAALAAGSVSPSCQGSGPGFHPDPRASRWRPLRRDPVAAGFRCRPRRSPGTQIKRGKGWKTFPSHATQITRWA